MKIKSKVRGGPRGCGGGIGLPTTDVQIPLGGPWRRGRLRGVPRHATRAAALAARRSFERRANEALGPSGGAFRAERRSKPRASGGRVANDFFRSYFSP